MSTSRHAADATANPPARVETGLQIFDALDAATEAALRASIKKHGVLVPVAVDQNGRTLDGHHRARIANELDVPFDTIQHWVGTDAEAKEIARTLNEDRRQLSVVQRREIVTDLREQGHSERAIAGAVGVARATVRRDLDQVGLPGPTETLPMGNSGPNGPVEPNRSTPVGVTPPARVKGTDGKSYPAVRRMPELPPAEKARLARESQQRMAHLNLTTALIPLNSDPIDPERYAERFADSLGERLSEFNPDAMEKAAAVLLAMAEIRRSM